MRLLYLGVKPDKKADKDGNGVAFGWREENLRELSESDHEIAVREFVEKGIHLFANLLLFFLLLSHIAKEWSARLCFLWRMSVLWIWKGLIVIFRKRWFIGKFWNWEIFVLELVPHGLLFFV